MVEKIYFVITLLLLCFACMYIGWEIGYADAKQKYRKIRNKEDNDEKNL